MRQLSTSEGAQQMCFVLFFSQNSLFRYAALSLRFSVSLIKTDCSVHIIKLFAALANKISIESLLEECMDQSTYIYVKHNASSFCSSSSTSPSNKMWYPHLEKRLHLDIKVGNAVLFAQKNPFVFAEMKWVFFEKFA